jgi:hypothetical protein
MPPASTGQKRKHELELVAGRHRLPHVSPAILLLLLLHIFHKCNKDVAEVCNIILQRGGAETLGSPSLPNQNVSDIDDCIGAMSKVGKRNNNQAYHWSHPSSGMTPTFVSLQLGHAFI